MKKYGSLIAKLRKKNNLTQAQLGEKLNISYQAVSKWENDLSEPDLVTIEKLADIFNITVSEFFDMANNPDKIYNTNSSITNNNISNTKPKFEFTKIVKSKPWYLVAGLGCIILLLSLIVALVPIKYSSSQIYKMVDPSVFCITLETSSGKQAGTGFFINDKGLAVTNYHVIEGATSGKIQLNNGKKYNIKKVVGYDENLDIAIIQINIKKSKPVRLGNSNKVKVGETVYAIGYPDPFGLGSVDSTLTQGIISKKSYTFEGSTYIQTTVDITGGNSGGVLVNRQGKVIGIITCSLTDDSGSVDYMNMAIPINKIRSVKRDLNVSLNELVAMYKNYTVTFINDGKVYDSFTVNYNAQIGPKGMSKTGYLFDGWYSDQQCTTQFDFSQRIKSNTTLYAKWTPIKYIIRFNSNGGSGQMTDMICEYDKEYTLPDNIFAFTHYDFKYWRIANKNYYPNTTTFKNLTETNNYTFECSAYWELSKYKITYRDKENKIIQSHDLTMLNFPYTVSYLHSSGCHYFDKKAYTDIDCTQILLDEENQTSYTLETPCNFDIYLNAYYVKDDFTYSYSGDETWIQNYVGTRKDVYFPSHVTKIYGTAFKDNKNVERVYIPNNIKGFPYRCFYGATALTYVELPENLIEIPGECFKGCSNLTTINIPQGVSTIGWGAFENCSNIECMELPNSLTKIENYVFKSCTKLKHIEFPSGLTTIETSAFANCIELKDINLPSALKQLESFAFENCILLEEITLPEGLKTIGVGAFQKCSTLQKINIPSTVIEVGSNMLYNTKFYNTQENWDEQVLYLDKCLLDIDRSCSIVNIKEDTRLIATGAFLYSDITYIKVDGIITDIPALAFAYSDKLEKVIIGNEIQNIRHDAFEACRILTNIILGFRVETIEYKAFNECESLENIYYCGTKEQFETIEIAKGNECFTNAKVYYFASKQPETEGDYWYYDSDGNVAVWEY